MLGAARRAASALGAGGARSFAAQALVSAEQSPFLRFGSPHAAAIDLAPALASLPETKVTRLPSGLRVITEATPHAATATVGVWIDAGSRFETAATNGTAHFLEHMAFKGTAARSAAELEVAVEDMGGHLNAFTSREQTCYYAKVAGGHVAGAVEILADILLNARLAEAAIERERGVILREMQEVEGMPQEVLFDHLHATAFQRCALGRPILGPAANVRALTRAHLADYVRANYTAPRMIVVGAGAVDHAALVKEVEKRFAALPTEGPTAEALAAASPSTFTGSEVRIRDPEMDRVHAVVAFRGAAAAEADSVPLMVMQSMLGAWDASAPGGGDAGSKLAQTVAANGLAESFVAFNTNYRDTGLFGVYAVADPKASNLEDLAWTVMRNVTSLCYGADESDVARARNQLKAALLFAEDGTTGAAEALGRGALAYGRVVPRAEMAARIDAVDAAAIRGVAEKYVLDRDIAVAALGDTQFLPDYTWLRRRTYWLRF